VGYGPGFVGLRNFLFFFFYGFSLLLDRKRKGLPWALWAEMLAGCFSNFQCEFDYLNCSI